MSPSVCVCVVHGLMSAVPDTRHRSVLPAQAVLLLDEASEGSFSGNWILRRDKGRRAESVRVCVCARVCVVASACMRISAWRERVRCVRACVRAASLIACKLCVFAGSGAPFVCSESLCFSASFVDE